MDYWETSKHFSVDAASADYLHLLLSISGAKKRQQR